MAYRDLLVYLPPICIHSFDSDRRQHSSRYWGVAGSYAKADSIRIQM